jgi:hypothetical protein
MESFRGHQKHQSHFDCPPPLYLFIHSFFYSCPSVRCVFFDRSPQLFYSLSMAFVQLSYLLIRHAVAKADDQREVDVSKEKSTQTCLLKIRVPLSGLRPMSPRRTMPFLAGIFSSFFLALFEPLPLLLL